MWHPQLVFVLASDREVITPAQIAAALRDLDATDTATGSRVGLRRVLPWRSRKSSVTLQPLAVQGFPATVGSARHGPSSPMPTPPLLPKPSEGSVNGQLKLPVGGRENCP